MTADDLVQIITAVTALIGAIASVVAVLRIQVIHKATNSLVTQLLIEGKDAARAEGTAIGLQQGRDEERPPPKIKQ